MAKQKKSEIGEEKQKREELDKKIAESLLSGGDLSPDLALDFLINFDPKIFKLIKKDINVNLITKETGRSLIDLYDQYQQIRIKAQNNMRAILQGFDTQTENKNFSPLIYVYENTKLMEEQIKGFINSWVSTQSVGRWLMANKGIGPILAGRLLVGFDITKAEYAGNFWSYAGLNDNNCPWLGNKGAEELYRTLQQEFGKDFLKTKTNDEIIIKIASLTKRSISNVTNSIVTESGTITRDSIIKKMAQPPFNKRLKKDLYLLGESFIKFSGGLSAEDSVRIRSEDVYTSTGKRRYSMYGEIIRERKLWESEKNERLEYKDQAKQILEEKSFSKDTDAYKWLSEGKLPPAHILSRARRYGEKIFVSHLFEIMYMEHYKKAPSNPYPIQLLGHIGYIKPEVPFSNFIEVPSEYYDRIRP